MLTSARCRRHHIEYWGSGNRLSTAFEGLNGGERWGEGDDVLSTHRRGCGSGRQDREGLAAR